MKKDKSIIWGRVDPSSLDLKGTNIAIVGGTGGLGRALASWRPAVRASWSSVASFETATSQG